MGPDVCDLVLDACDLLERARGSEDDALLAGEAELLRAELCAALAHCDDDAIAADGHAVVAELDTLLARPSHRAALLLALSA